jgi:hypothetical protein
MLLTILREREIMFYISVKSCVEETRPYSEYELSRWRPRWRQPESSGMSGGG